MGPRNGRRVESSVEKTKIQIYMETSQHREERHVGQNVSYDNSFSSIKNGIHRFKGKPE